MSLILGSVTLPKPAVVLAPMAGITDRPFRRLARRFGCHLAWSEMVASRELLRARGRSLSMCDPDDGDGAPFAVQLAGCDPEIMAEAARFNADRGVALIDINMGCPVKKVVGGQGGAALMRDEALAGRIMEAVVTAVDIPVTLKTRLGWGEGDLTAPSLVRVAEAAGIRLVTIHGRTRASLYAGRADWAAIRAVRDATSLPLLANGDVRSLEEARGILRETGADGVMIGRAALGAPWVPGRIARGLAAEAEGRAPPAAPPLVERLDAIAEHFEGLMDLHGPDRGVRVSRKHMGWYAENLPGGADFRTSYMAAGDVDAARSVLMDYLDRLRMDGEDTPSMEKAA
ncbi:MAG: tRNA dihydrouridine synthase DusB [Rhodospirillum sp.]|nr:tRNA dihydrouridine synthase DusB [Rhodospirillum sp.]MCF8487737.1 tRNA dihydrouridine synthase DusB [Rhodospirillum sp.]MCF8500385.1 tRNA dihydrouridine synthase DusB [Rhodospirillum sp.]